MTRLERIEKDVQSLSLEELAAFRAWFHQYDADAWDREIERDARDGRLDALADQAIEHHRAGRTREL